MMCLSFASTVTVTYFPASKVFPSDIVCVTIVVESGVNTPSVPSLPSPNEFPSSSVTFTVISFLVRASPEREVIFTV